MEWWIYKCNTRQHKHQRAYGDWHNLFSKNRTDDWGSSDWIPDLAKLRKGDKVIAYQTNRNELVGIAKVHQSCNRDTYVYLSPIQTIGVKVRPLKKSDPKIAAIPALQPGPIKTVYDISVHDARTLLKAAGAAYKITVELTPEAKDINEPPKKVQFTTYRILRDTTLTSDVKRVHKYKCQICHASALKISANTLYAEAHHIKPLGSPHGGLDVLENVLCVCPNCHVLLDYGAIRLDASRLSTNPKHKVGENYIKYHNTHIFGKK